MIGKDGPVTITVCTFGDDAANISHAADWRAGTDFDKQPWLYFSSLLTSFMPQYEKFCVQNNLPMKHPDVSSDSGCTVQRGKPCLPCNVTCILVK